MTDSQPNNPAPPVSLDDLRKQINTIIPWCKDEDCDMHLPEAQGKEIVDRVMAVVSAYTERARWIKGTKCPNGCGETLFVGNGGYVTCSWAECPNRDYDDALKAHVEQEALKARVDEACHFGRMAHKYGVRHDVREAINARINELSATHHKKKEADHE